MDRTRKKQVGSQLVSSGPWQFFHCRERRARQSKGLAAPSFFAYEDKRMATGVLHLSTFINHCAWL